MTRSELVENISSSNLDISLFQAERAVDLLLEEITKTLSKKGRVELRGFGVFTVREREGRVGRNPRTGKSVNVSSKYVPFFKAGKELKARLNKDS